MFNVFRWLSMFDTRRGSSSPLRYSKKPRPSGISHSPLCSSPVRPETMKSGGCPASPKTVMAP